MIGTVFTSNGVGQSITMTTVSNITHPVKAIIPGYRRPRLVAVTVHMTEGFHSWIWEIQHGSYCLASGTEPNRTEAVCAAALWIKARQ